ncbi:MAG: type II secretion system F family protein [Oscillospiraceae bacterium]|nr:type II secretion system F family protein [Oscillospiraceae bacterium]
MHYILLITATLLITAWLVLLFRVTKEDWVQAAYAKVFDDHQLMKKLRIKDIQASEKQNGYSGFLLTVIKKIYGNSNKKIEKLETDINRLHTGNLKSVNIFLMPGYVLQREVSGIGKGNIHKMIISKCFELYGKKHATKKTKQILAKILSYPIIGVAVTLLLGAVFSATGNVTVGGSISGLGTLLIFVLIYAIYDELNDLVQKRRSAIIKQFPNVVSKLALLVTSGMIMDRAWKETAYSRESELYREMRITSKELDNLVSPEVAYSNFINSCNTKESAKLACAIMQNLSKGNAEIGRLLKDMAREAWLERRHIAKRDAEKANSKLMIPTMLLFLAILVMLMVPVAMNFSSF